MSIDSSLLDILVCPECRGPLDYQERHWRMTCSRCRLAFPINEHDVPLLIADEASPYVPEQGKPPHR